MEKPEKTLILVRHAHRDTSDPSADNGLSRKGRGQAAVLLKRYVKFVEAAGKGPKPLVLSSQKLRCVETVLPIARHAGVKVQVTEQLYEQGARESFEAMRTRARDFCAWWKDEGPPLVIACSHGDWLPAAVLLLTRAHVEISKGAWIEIGLVGGRPVVRSVAQGR